MHIISTILVIVVALEAIGIMLLEMFGSPQKPSVAFGFSEAYTRMAETRISMKNQGLYNGFIGIGLLINRFAFPETSQYSGSILFVAFVCIASVYGAITAQNIKILLLQGTPAILALLSLLFLK